jgi:hypothetical protein
MHFLFECEAHAEQRRKLATIIGRGYLNLKAIMSEVKFMKALTHVIDKTGRFDADH